jgi:hypothetical protein
MSKDEDNWILVHYSTFHFAVTKKRDGGGKVS